MTIGTVIQLGIVLTLALVPQTRVFLFVMHLPLLTVAFPFVWLFGALLEPLSNIISIPMSTPTELEEFGQGMGLVMIGGVSHVILAVTIATLVQRAQESKARRARLADLHARILKARRHPA
jgi:glucose-6-phosphate-specific signal transduction histidine kinase